MNVLILGSGGREHAFAWKIAQSKQLENLFIAPGNAGTANCGTNVNLGVNDFEGIKKLVWEKSIDLVLVGPEDPLVNGIHDFFAQDEILFLNLMSETSSVESLKNGFSSWEVLFPSKKWKIG